VWGKTEKKYIWAAIYISLKVYIGLGL